MAEPTGIQLAQNALPAPSTNGRTKPTKLFTRHSAAELALPVGPIEFLVTGLLARPTYGQIAGELKTMKSHVAAWPPALRCSATSTSTRPHRC